MRLRIFTFNCWAIAYVPILSSDDRKARIKAIAKYLAGREEDQRYDVVCLQEVWTRADQEIIKLACRDNLPYAVSFYGGVIGPGTMILSRWPILSTNYKKFTLNGYKHQIWYGDALAGSGIGLAKLMIGTDDDHYLVNAYVSHYHAEYNREHDDYKADRLVQALEAGEWINWTSKQADAVIYCGDFNTEAGDLPHRVLTGFYGLNDAQEAVFPKMSTCYANENSYRSWDGDSNPRPITIDYIMYKSTFATKVENVGRPLSTRRVEATGKSYSDHEALEASLKFSLGGGEARRQEDSDDNGLLLKDIKDVLEAELQSTKWWQLLHTISLLAFFAAAAGLFVACCCICKSNFWIILGIFIALAMPAFHLCMMGVYLERRCSLKATVQSLFGLQGQNRRRRTLLNK